MQGLIVFIPGPSGGYRFYQRRDVDLLARHLTSCKQQDDHYGMIKIQGKLLELFNLPHGTVYDIKNVFGDMKYTATAYSILHEDEGRSQIVLW